jgi:hypothetical protein
LFWIYLRRIAEKNKERWKMNKWLSGRWIFTVTCALAFIYCVVRKILPPIDIKEIIMLVVVFYFMKNGNTPKGELKP